VNRRASRHPPFVLDLQEIPGMQTLTFDYQVTLEQLNRNVTLPEKIRTIHRVIQDRLGFIDRVAAAIYDPKTDLLKTFVDSGGKERPLVDYQAKPSDSYSLRQILGTGHPRVFNDLAVFHNVRRPHAQQMAKQGYGSSYTMPMHHNGAFFGFLFFDAYAPGCFEPESLHALDVFGHLIALVIMNELSRLRMLAGAITAARDLTHQRDSETRAYLDRMAYYARLIARHLAPRYGLEDAYVERIFLFAPLHDISKIGLPGRILCKKGRLTSAEFELMKTHTTRGREIIDKLVEDFGLEDLEDMDALRNIAMLHHEAINGAGYPLGLVDGAIPLEARIIAVADVFDALTSRRPYKRAWTNGEAVAMLKQLAGIKLDADCVSALVEHPEEFQEIQARFQENPYG
jgi:HD-GYP domain-containing protein (c-di-GMP phosphodiesterase class II)